MTQISRVADERKTAPLCCADLVYTSAGSDDKVVTMIGDDDDKPGIEAAVGRAGVQSVSPAALRRQRHRRKLSLRQLSVLSGVGAATISAWEAGNRAPSARLLAAVAVALQVSVADLVPVTQRRLVLADLRHQAGLSQRAAAEAVGLSPSMFQAIETGFRPADQTQRAILAAQLGVSVGEFVTVWERTREAYIERAKIR